MNARLAALAALVLGTGCQSFSAPDSVVYGTAVITNTAPGTRWSSFTTFSVDPLIAVVDDTGSVSTSCSVPSTQLVPTIRNELEARGYTWVDWDPSSANTGADLQIKISAHLGSADYYYAGYCGWYPYYYYCYPGWSYAGSYSFGTLVLDMGDAKDATVGGRIPLVWTAAGYGVLASYYSGCTNNQNGAGINWGRIQEAVYRAFDQSPYIVK